MLDLITVRFMLGYMTRPLHLFGGIGMLSTGLGILIGLYLVFVKLIQGQDIGSRPLLILSVLLVIVGVQFIGMGLLAELIVRTYYEATDKRIYVVREVLDGETVDASAPAAEPTPISTSAREPAGALPAASS
jgi:hypothetical protein